MHAYFVRNFVFPLQEFLKGNRTYKHLKELERTQWLSTNEMQEFQFRRLKEHLEFAYHQVPYYNRLLNEHGLQPSRITSVDDFSRIPFLTKEIIRKHSDELRPRTQRRRVKRVSSGGSTGNPVSVFVDADRIAFDIAARLRAHRWFDVDIGAREVALWGSPIELTQQDTLRKIRDRLINSRLLSAFNLGKTKLAENSEILKQFKPLKIVSYPSALYLFARYLKSAGFTANGRWPKAIFLTAEPLYDFQRELIESVFHCPVLTEYGCREGGLIANECPKKSLHVNAEGILVEVCGTVGIDGSGEIVITNMNSLAMPLIRYRTGDVSSIEKGLCSCGRELPRLRSVEGRRSDFLITPGGRVIHGQAVAYLLREDASIRESIREFQVIQERFDRVVVNIVPDERFSDRTKLAIITSLGRLFVEKVSIDVSVIDVIPRPASQKRRDVISNVADTYLDSLIG
jgi:phenylacetate-coenzyme A ligase PaaK-like adenylate-forming protein